jgi:type IX secretion system PorP/SprF family membrane protein
MYKIFRSIIFFLIIGSKIFAQDVHFSQFYNSPLTLNPSQTGDFNGDWRISTNYRTQWGAIANKPYESYSLGFDKPEYYYTQKISWGIIAVRDQSFLNLNTTKLFGSVSSGIEINKHQIILGVQFGIVNKTTDFSAYSFDSQFDLGGSSVFNPSFSNREDAEEGIYYFDMNAGVQWSKKLSEKFKPMIGLAFFHLTNPVESFTSISEEDATIGLRTNFHLGGQFKSTSKLTLHPLMIYTQQKNFTPYYNISTDTFPFNIKDGNSPVGCILLLNVCGYFVYERILFRRIGTGEEEYNE